MCRIIYKDLSQHDRKMLLIFCGYFWGQICDRKHDYHDTINRDDAVKAQGRLRTTTNRLLDYFDDNEGCDLVWNTTSNYVDYREQVNASEVVNKLKDFINKKYHIKFVG